MGHEWIERVIAALKQSGIRAQRGYPAGYMPCLDSPAAAVCVQQLQTDATMLAVCLYVPVSQGGSVCEDAAIAAAQVLRGLGGECKVERCGFDGKMDVFSQTVYVTFRRNATKESWSVKVDGAVVPHASSFKAEYLSVVNRTFNTTTGQPIFNREDDGWRLTIEELLPEDRPAEDENMDIFSVEYSSGAGVQRYEHCCWERILVEPVVSGIHRIRVARAARSPVITPLT